MSKIILILCLVMANVQDSSFIYIEYDTMEECKEAWERISKDTPPPEVKQAFGVCTDKVQLNEKYLSDDKGI